MDDAAGVASLIEIASMMKKTKPKRSVLSDGYGRG
jgi:Zn-dependent M28 family amino/carboxypeptidase